MPPSPNAHDLERARRVLGVSESASPEEIHKAYKAESLKQHPDKGGDNATQVAINEAYEWLRDVALPPREHEWAFSAADLAAATARESARREEEAKKAAEEQAAREAVWGPAFQSRGAKGRAMPMSSTSGTNYGPTPEVNNPKKGIEWDAPLSRAQRKKFDPFPKPSKKDSADSAQPRIGSGTKVESSAESKSAPAPPPKASIPANGTKRARDVESDSAPAPAPSPKRPKTIPSVPAQSQDGSGTKAKFRVESDAGVALFNDIFSEVEWDSPLSRKQHKKHDPEFVEWLEEESMWEWHMCYKEKNGFKMMGSQRRGGNVILWKYCCANGAIAMAVDRFEINY